MTATTRRQWARQMMVWAFVLMPLGLALMVWGAFMAGGTRVPLAGFALGSVGVGALTVGGFLGRFAVAGPYPARLLDDRKEVDD